MKRNRKSETERIERVIPLAGKAKAVGRGSLDIKDSTNRATESQRKGSGS